MDLCHVDCPVQRWVPYRQVSYTVSQVSYTVTKRVCGLCTVVVVIDRSQLSYMNLMSIICLYAVIPPVTASCCVCEDESCATQPTWHEAGEPVGYLGGPISRDQTHLQQGEHAQEEIHGTLHVSSFMQLVSGPSCVDKFPVVKLTTPTTPPQCL